MSLVNDALRRAKQQTSQPAPASSLRLRPLEPVQEAAARSPRSFPLVFVTISIVVVALAITRWLNVGAPAKDSHPISISNSAPTPAAQPVNPVPVKNSKPMDVKAAPANERNSETVPETAALTEPPVVSLPVSAPQPAPVRLQAIFFNARRPSAMVNGKTVFAGSHVGEFQVAAISPETVTLINGATTNLLQFNE